MPVPYLLTALLYTLVALFIAADSALINFTLLSAFPALRWVRVHFITLGLLSQIVFGLLPVLIASLSKKKRPAMRWDIWALLNLGFIVLIAGFSGVNQPMIFAGGTLVFIATMFFFMQLLNMRNGSAPASLKFYITGLFYLLVGIVVGTGIFLNWSEALYVKVPLEVHIHANSWGFMSLVFAGLLVDFVPMVTGRPLNTAKNISLIYWGMTLGAFGLILGPWLGGSLPPLVSGLLLHMSSTIWLVVSTYKAFKLGGKLNSAGAWLLISSYIWITAPILTAPLVIFKIIESGPTEAFAPQALIYGWVLQFGIALIPYIARKFFLAEKNPTLGGNWFTLVMVSTGCLLVWLGIYIVPVRPALHGTAYSLYTLALVYPLKELFEIVRDGLKKYQLA
jgi:hypothetical protein